MSNPLIFAQIADKILGIIESFLDPAQYDVVMLKRLKKAANAAEKDFENTSKLLIWVESQIELNPEKEKELKKFKKVHEKYVKYHQKYD